MEHFAIFSGTANRRLADAIADELEMPLAGCEIARFPDGEVGLELQEPVLRREVFIVQPTGPPVDPHLVELLAFVDACRRAGAARITAVVPYFGYARADRRGDRLESITASVVALLLQTAGVDHLVTVDLHTAQIEGFFHIPVESLTAASALATALQPALPPGTVVVAPDAGRVRMATKYAQQLGAALAVLHKQRLSGSETHVTHVVGDVRDRSCLIIDDMISTGGTIAEAAAALQRAGASPEFLVAATHGLFVGGAPDKLAEAGIGQLWVTDTVDVHVPGRIQAHVVSVAPLIAGTLRRLMAQG